MYFRGFVVSIHISFPSRMISPYTSFSVASQFIIYTYSDIQPPEFSHYWNKGNTVSELHDIYRVPISIFVPWIWPLRRESCTISTNVCIQAHITWMDNSHSLSSVVIFVTCLSSSTSFTYRVLISIPLVKRMCLVLGRQLWQHSLSLLFLWTVFNLYPQVPQFRQLLHCVLEPL